MSVYFNDNEPYVTQWLGNLYPDATIDSRSISDVRANDLLTYKRCHFFAGIGGWEYALSLAQWPSGREVWTGSCPCQPFSQAGQRHGEADKRHLWPGLRRLIDERRPATIFGEQVSSNLGRAWLARVRADLEELGYAVGCADLCAASVGAPHIRQRLYWVADDASARLEGNGRKGVQESGYRSTEGGESRRMAHTNRILSRQGVRTEQGALTEALRSKGPDLAAVAATARWTTPTGTERSGQGPKNKSLMQDARGVMPNGLTVPTEGRGALNPDFPRWLMGFPPEWASCAPTAMPSSRKSPQPSSAPSSKRKKNDE